MPGGNSALIDWSMTASVLALIDDAMIAIEMMARKIEEGFDRFSAATFAYTSTAFPMLTGTLITAAGFLPVGFAKSGSGEYVFSLFQVVGISLMLSWIVAVVFTPWLGYKLLDPVKLRAIAEKHGGMGMPWLTYALMYEQLARVSGDVAISLLIQQLGAYSLEVCSNDAMRDKYLPRMLRAEIIACSGISEPGVGSNVAEVTCRAQRDGDHYIINGQKTWTTLAQHADMIFCLCRTAPGAKKQMGISFIVFSMKSKGVTVRPIITIDGSTGDVIEGKVAMIEPELTGDFQTLMAWADAARRLKVRANAETPLDASTARGFGAEGIGLCRTEHMFFDDTRIAAVREMILADDEAGRRAALAKIEPFQKTDFVELFKIMAGLPVTIRLLDPPLHEFLPHSEEDVRAVAAATGLDADKLMSRAKALHETNPMLGHRGCRLGVAYPEIYEMQVRAIIEAALEDEHYDAPAVGPAGAAVEAGVSARVGARRAADEQGGSRKRTGYRPPPVRGRPGIARPPGGDPCRGIRVRVLLLRFRGDETPTRRPRSALVAGAVQRFEQPGHRVPAVQFG